MYELALKTNTCLLQELSPIALCDLPDLFKAFHSTYLQEKTLLNPEKPLLTFGRLGSCPNSLIHIKYFFSLHPNVLKSLVICVDAILQEFAQCYRAGSREQEN